LAARTDCKWPSNGKLKSSSNCSAQQAAIFDHQDLHFELFPSFGSHISASFRWGNRVAVQGAPLRSNNLPGNRRSSDVQIECQIVIRAKKAIIAMQLRMSSLCERGDPSTAETHFQNMETSFSRKAHHSASAPKQAAAVVARKWL
jgi:hypothetical protein